VIEEVSGRSTDFVVRPDGTIMHALAVIYVLRALDGVAQFKLIQHALRTVEVLVVPTKAWNEGVCAQLVSGLASRLGQDVHVDVRLVDSIAPEASGKYRYVVSHVAPRLQ
jgi:phenylacetate-CoA ligase